MELIKLECDSCGYTLTADRGRITTICSNCGKQNMINDGVRKIEFIDESELYKVKAMQKQFLERKAQDEADDAAKAKKFKKSLLWTICALIYHVACIVLTIVTMYFALEQEQNNKAISALLMTTLSLSIVCPVILTVTNPRNSYSKDKVKKERRSRYIFLLVTTGAAYLLAAILGVMIFDR